MHEKMKRLDQIVLIGMFIGFSWLAMQAVHEFGHILGAVTSGGHVTKIVLHPCTISRTDVHPNPHPLFVAWAGLIVGVLLPLLSFLLARALRSGPAFFSFASLLASASSLTVFTLASVQSRALPTQEICFGKAHPDGNSSSLAFSQPRLGYICGTDLVQNSALAKQGELSVTQRLSLPFSF